ncbi:MAG: putative RNA-binding protein (virulence factor B family) [Cyclobacteriaceae bacterium]|jgi:predicted RNA-binding protein (virulence factor B family)
MAIPIVKIGDYNTLRVLKETDFGIYVGDEVEEILMPTKWVPEGTEVDDEIEVFIYNDSEDRIIATTMTPKIIVNHFACLKVKQVTPVGAFLDWGLEKDLFAPFKEQQDRMEEGKSYVVFMYLDELTDRLVASSQLNKFFEHENIELEIGQEVDLMIYKETDLGYKALVEGKYTGLIYMNEVFTRLMPGDQIKGYVKNLREDNLIDLSINKVGFESIEPNADKILEKLKENGGSLKLHDKSEPEEIYKLLNMSKKNFKKAVGTLYKKRLIAINETNIELT